MSASTPQSQSQQLQNKVSLWKIFVFTSNRLKINLDAILIEQNKLVEPLYQMEKNGELSGEGDKGMQGVPFLDGQIVKGGQMLGNIWYTAWLEAPEDTYLERQLDQRATAGQTK